MSWSPLAPAVTAAKKCAVALGCRAPGRRRLPGLRMVLRTDALGGADFLSAGARVDVLHGAGDHAGMLRIVPGKTFALGRPGREKSRTLTLEGIAPPRGVAASEREPEAVEFDYGADWLELTLPGWAKAPAAPPPATKQPYSLSDRVPDPAAALRGPGR